MRSACVMLFVCAACVCYASVCAFFAQRSNSEMRPHSSSSPLCWGGQCGFDDRDITQNAYTYVVACKCGAGLILRKHSKLIEHLRTRSSRSVAASFTTQFYTSPSRTETQTHTHTHTQNDDADAQTNSDNAVQCHCRL